MVDFDTSSYVKPAAAPQQQNFLQSAQQYGNMAQQSIGIDSAKLALAQNHFNALNQNLGATLSAPEVQPDAVKSNPQAASDFITNQVQNMYKQGLLTQSQVAQEMSQIPSVQQMQQDPTALQNHLNLALNRTASNAENFQRQYGANFVDDNGAGTISGTVAPKTGARRAASFTPKQPGPGTTTILQPNAQGQLVPTAVNNQALYNKTAYPNGQTPPLVQPVAPNAQPTQPTASPTPAAAPQAPAGKPSAAVAASAPVQTAQNLPGVQVGPAVGSEQAVVGSANAGVQSEQNFNTSLQGSQTRKSQIANINSALDKVSTGPLSGAIHKYGATLNQAGQLVAGKDIVPPESISAYEEGVKNATQLSQSQAATLGSSVAALGSAGHTVPDFNNNSTLGNKRIAAVLNGNEDAIQSMGEAWGKYKQANPGANFNDWQRDKFLPTFDPRAYQFSYMDPAARADMLKSIPKTLPNGQMNPQYSNFVNTLNAAVQAGKVKGDK